jgi:hypothetical protein
VTTSKAGKAIAPRSFTEIARSEEALAAQTRALEAALQVRACVLCSSQPSRVVRRRSSHQ